MMVGSAVSKNNLKTVKRVIMFNTQFFIIIIATLSKVKSHDNAHHGLRMMLDVFCKCIECIIELTVV